MNRKKVQLLANDKAGVPIDWDARVGEDPTQWLASEKKDGCRLEMEDGQPFSREFKLNPSVHINEMANKLWDKVNIPGIVEAEFWAPGMNFSEISHFFKSADVTSAKSKKKHFKEWEKTKGGTTTYKRTKNGVIIDQPWEYPGRTPEWLTTWHPELGFHAFDHVLEGESRTKEERYRHLTNGMPYFGEYLNIIHQWVPNHIDEIYQAYDQSILDGGEGLVIMRRKSLYKHGRLTLNEAQGYKIKDNNVEFEGVIIGVEEGTIAREGAVKTINAFGRSKTSQLAEDRIPSGLCKGFMVRMDDGNELTVSLKGYSHADRKALLYGQSDWIGMRIMFTGSNPVKVGGKPRHAHYSR